MHFNPGSNSIVDQVVLLLVEEKPELTGVVISLVCADLDEMHLVVSWTESYHIMRQPLRHSWESCYCRRYYTRMRTLLSNYRTMVCDAG